MSQNKLAFSTVGCPDWKWRDILATAKDLGVKGIEIRGIENEIFAPHIKYFSDERIEQTVEKINSLGLTIPVLASNVILGGDDESEILSEARAYIDLGAKLGAMVRVLVSSRPEPEQVDLTVAASRLKKICDYGADKKVTILIETNGTLANSRKMKDFVYTVGAPNLKVLWDINHPYRYYGEQPAQTLQNLGDLIAHVHLKDSITTGDKVIYRMMGYGDVPIAQAVKALQDIRYSGYYTLEWVKRWNPDLEEPGVVFSHYISYMQRILSL